MQHPSDIADVEPDEAAVGDRLRYRIDRACDGGKCRIEDRGRGRRSKPAVGNLAVRPWMRRQERMSAL